MSGTINIAFKNSNRIYYECDNVSGVVVIDSKTGGKHDGIVLSFEGLLSIQMSGKNSGILDSFVQNTKAVVLSSHSQELAKPGKLPPGRTQIPFDFTLNPNPNKVLYESFHGNNIIIQYVVKCDIKKSFLSKEMSKSQEIIVYQKFGAAAKVIESPSQSFQIKPDTVQNARERARLPDFLIEGHLDSTEIVLSKPISGEFLVKKCDRGISSVELQLLRIETCGSNEVNTKEVSEIQNAQLGCGDIPRGLVVPIYMVLPRFLTCSTVIAPTFKIEFQLNFLIVFDNDHQVMESFPIKLIRY